MAGRRRSPGRPTKRSATTTKVLVAALVAGNTRRNAAQLAGINYATLKRWCRLSAPFCAQLERAEAQAEARIVKSLQTMAQKGNNFQAARFWLRTRRHDEWREPPDEITITDRRAEAEAIAAEIGQAGETAVIDQIHQDLLLSQEAVRR